jgi:hypothetical protein
MFFVGLTLKKLLDVINLTSHFEVAPQERQHALIIPTLFRDDIVNHGVETLRPARIERARRKLPTKIGTGRGRG